MVAALDTLETACKSTADGDIGRGTLDRCVEVGDRTFGLVLERLCLKALDLDRGVPECAGIRVLVNTLVAT